MIGFSVVHILFGSYLMTLFQYRDYIASDIKMIDDFERTWRELVVA
jgi:hypothetical protein